MSKNHFNHIGLIARTDSQLVLESLRRVRDFLQNRQCNILMEDTAEAVLKDYDGPVFSQEQMADKCDLVLAETVIFWVRLEVLHHTVCLYWV